MAQEMHRKREVVDCNNFLRVDKFHDVLNWTRKRGYGLNAILIFEALH